MKTNKRDNEFSALLNRDRMEQVPPGIDAKLWNGFREKYNNASLLFENESPAQLDIELNSNCNMACSFCIHSIEENRNTGIEYEKYTKIIDEAISLNIRSLKLNYMNEPLLVRDLEKFIDYALKAGMVNVFMSSNGLLLTERRAKSLIESGITKLFVSLDATTADVYLKLRNNSKFDQIVKNILKFLEIRNEMGLEYPLLRVNFLKTNTNAHQEQDFIDFWENKADIVIIQEMNELIDQKTDLFIEKEVKEFHCSFPFKQLVVNADGHILPCCTMHGIKLKLGNISTMTLEEAWNSKKAKYLRQLHKDGKYMDNKVCRYCITGK